MKKRAGKRIAPRRRWVINPKTRVVESERAYKRQAIKKETKELYGKEDKQA